MPSSSQRPAGPAKGELIRTLRMERGFTQEQLAQRAGISEWQLSRIERGKAEPSRDTLERIAPVLRTTVGYFDPRALGEAVAERATAPNARTVVERVLAVHDRIAVMSNAELQKLCATLDEIGKNGNP